MRRNDRQLNLPITFFKRYKNFGLSSNCRKKKEIRKEIIREREEETENGVIDLRRCLS